MVRLQGNLGKQSFQEDMKKLFEPVTHEDITEILKLTSKKNNKALEKLNDRHLENRNNSIILASYLLSLLYKITNPEHTSQFQLVKDLNSNRVNEFLLNKTKPVTIYNNLLTYRDRNKKFELQGDRLTVTTNKNYNVDLANLPD